MNIEANVRPHMRMRHVCVDICMHANVCQFGPRASVCWDSMDADISDLQLRVGIHCSLELLHISAAAEQCSDLAYDLAVI